MDGTVHGDVQNAQNHVTGSPDFAERHLFLRSETWKFFSCSRQGCATEDILQVLVEVYVRIYHKSYDHSYYHSVALDKCVTRPQLHAAGQEIL